MTVKENKYLGRRISCDEEGMRAALELAQLASEHDEVPVGAVIVLNERIIGVGYNQSILSHDPTAHAEVNAIRLAGETQNNYRLTGATMYVTIEPCTMCCGALLHSRISRLVFGAREPKAGAVVSVLTLFDTRAYNHKVDVSSGVLEQECSAVISDFFARRRNEKKRKNKHD